MIHKVAILAHPNVALFELGCATELFALPRPEFEHWYQADVIRLTTTPINILGGIAIECRAVESLDIFDTLVIPSWPSHDSQVAPEIAQPIIDFAQRGGRLVTFCSGAFLLGYLGLLDARSATTHWQYEALFRQTFPRCDYQSNVLYVLEDGFGCSAGSTAALDLGLAIIREDHGSDIANKVARRLVLSGHRKGGQAQYVDTPVQPPPRQLGEVMDWAITQLATKIRINDLATKANMSRRSFDRVFRQQTGLSPNSWLLSQRIAHACRLLEDTGFSIEQVATQCGFSNVANFRHQFRKQLALSPRQYRDNFSTH